MLQRVNINDSNILCDHCGNKITEIKNIKYAKKNIDTPTYREELYFCRQCNTVFLMRYDFFTESGHINSKIFSEDVNDPEYNWQNSLTSEQKNKIAEHIKDCTLCQNELEEELLMNAWFSSLIRNKS